VANAARASTQAHRLLVVATKAFPLQAMGATKHFLAPIASCCASIKDRAL
jgi:hypothetical protein